MTEHFNKLTSAIIPCVRQVELGQAKKAAATVPSPTVSPMAAVKNNGLGIKQSRSSGTIAATSGAKVP